MSLPAEKDKGPTPRQKTERPGPSTAVRQAQVLSNLLSLIARPLLLPSCLPTSSALSQQIRSSSSACWPSRDGSSSEMIVFNITSCADTDDAFSQLPSRSLATLRCWIEVDDGILRKGADGPAGHTASRGETRPVVELQTRGRHAVRQRGKKDKPPVLAYERQLFDYMASKPRRLAYARLRRDHV